MLIERDMTEFSCPRTGPTLTEQAPMQADRDLISPQAQLQLCQIEREPAAYSSHDGAQRMALSCQS